MDNSKKAAMFLDWWNNFLTVDRFAEYYGISPGQAVHIINEGRHYHEQRIIICKLCQ